MEYLTAKQLLLIYSMTMDETGGANGVRDNHAILLLEDLHRREFFGKELYPTLFLKAAVYARNIITEHPFVDGNKRTVMVAASVFLENNNYKITAKEGEIEKFALTIIKKKLNLKMIAEWFKEHSQKIRK